MATTKQKPASLTKTLIRTYVKRLEGEEGCNFHYKRRGDPSSLTKRCKGGTDKSLSRKILKRLGVSDKDIGRVHAFATKHGGHCDCEILFNARTALRKKSWK